MPKLAKLHIGEDSSFMKEIVLFSFVFFFVFSQAFASKGHESIHSRIETKRVIKNQLINKGITSLRDANLLIYLSEHKSFICLDVLSKTQSDLKSKITNK